MEILKAIVFGIVEGVTEWLPISSTGHLILLNEFLRLDVSSEFQTMFDVVIQLGAILAVIVLFFHKLNPFSPSKDRKQRHNTVVLWLKIVVAILPSGLGDPGPGLSGPGADPGGGKGYRRGGGAL